MNMMQQLLIVVGVLVALPFAVKLLWRLYLLPLVCWLAATRLFWPKWAAANETLCMALLLICIMVFLGAWSLRYAAKKQREKELIAHVLATAPIMEYRPGNTFHGETE